jgi:hypothetical protein
MSVAGFEPSTLRLCVNNSTTVPQMPQLKEGNEQNYFLIFNEGKSAASFCHQVAAWLPDMFCNFYKVKNHKIAKTQLSQKLEEK